MEEILAQEDEKFKQKTIDNKHFFDPSLFPQFNFLITQQSIISSELNHALRSKIVLSEIENGSKLSGAWCEDKIMEEFYIRNKDEEGWLHWWSTHNPEKPNDDWTVFGLVHKGKYMTENCKKCPKTVELLSQIPGIRVAGFSRLQPKAGIETHCGFTGRRYGALAFHLGLVIPKEGAWLKCGEDTHYWKKAGDVLIFDDTFPHSAWNESDQERIILYIDFMISEENEKKLPEFIATENNNNEYKEEEEEEEEKEREEERRIYEAFLKAALRSAKKAKEKKEKENNTKKAEEKENSKLDDSSSSDHEDT